MSSPPIASWSPLLLYAELLLHINRVSLYGSIDIPASTESTATLYTEGPLLRVTHGELTASLRLPVNTIKSAPSSVHFPVGRPKVFSARLEVEAEHVLTLRNDVGGEVPWGAKDLNNESQLNCKSCGHSILTCDVKSNIKNDDMKKDDQRHTSVRIREWKDLPSENWAEMMDFWHCHKPVDHKQDAANGDSHSEKGYAASNALQAVPGVGLVDVSSFLFAPEDVTAVEAAPDSAKSSTISKASEPKELVCASPACAHLLGLVDDRAAGHRIHKWAVEVQPNAASKRQSYPPEQWATAQMLSRLESESIREFFIPAAPLNTTTETSSGRPPELEDSWLLRLFTPDLYYCSAESPPITSASSSSEQPSDPTQDQRPPPPPTLRDSAKNIEPAEPVRACKILYRRRSPVDPSSPTAGQEASSFEETLSLPPPLRTALLTALFESARVLPRTARTEGGWRIGLLRRFARETS